MNKNPISETEREVLRAQLRKRVERCTEDLHKLYTERELRTLEKLLKAQEEEYFNE